MVQTNLFAGQVQRCRCREWTKTGRGEWDESGSGTDMPTTMGKVASYWEPAGQ